jgi:hypothetical protein
MCRVWHHCSREGHGYHGSGPMSDLRCTPSAANYRPPTIGRRRAGRDKDELSLDDMSATTRYDSVGLDTSRICRFVMVVWHLIVNIASYQGVTLAYVTLMISSIVQRLVRFISLNALLSIAEIAF